MSDIYRKMRDKYVGKGGLRCGCCGDIKKKDKRKINKIGKQFLKRELTKEVLDIETND